MSTAAQQAANRANSEFSTGPRTPGGRARAAANSTTVGLFTASNHVEPGEEEVYAAFLESWRKELQTEGATEDTIAIEIVSAAWRLRRCSILESNLAPAEDPDALQRSVDRARNQSHRLFMKGIAELRKLQTERQLRFELKLENDETLVGYRDIIRNLSVQASWDLKKHRLESVASVEQIIEKAVAPPAAAAPAPAQTDGLKITANRLRFVNQPAAPQPAPDSTPRNATCPCKSGEKYKRCCSRNAPPVLSKAAWLRQSHRNARLPFRRSG